VWLSGLAGTLRYCAPEILSGFPYLAEKTDMFSLGVLIFFLVLGHFPFEQASIEKDE
jgi:serine/threonine protein kinase